uniref:Uncharacterized protein n=1 Tax=Tanacetum cinerariifolium TaxID=118510 RepID=A0A6L2JFU2_TANCI|nr:hypothetical protein [Tanacetum cinerariifolium]
MTKMNNGIGLSMTSDGTCNEVDPVGDTATVMEGVTPSMTDMILEKDKLSSLEDTTVLGYFSPLSMPVTTLAGNALDNAHGKSLYANITGKPSGKKVNVHNFFKPGCNGIDVIVLVDSIRAASDNDGNLLVPMGIVECDSEVDVVFDETSNLRISTSGKDRSDKGYGKNSLLEQCRDSYPDNDDYDPYDDDFDITVCGKKNK